MRIGIEATSAVEAQKAGVGYYTYNVIRSLALLPNTTHTYTLYLRHPSSEALISFSSDPESSSRFTPKVLNSPYLWAQMRLPMELWRHPQDVYFFPSSVIPLCYQPQNSVISVHDVAFLFFQEYFSPMLRRWLTIATKRGIQKARKIIAVSEATRQDILSYYNVAPETVVTIHHGVREMFQPYDRETVAMTKKTYQIDGAYMLCVGTLQRRKNIPRLIQAFSLLKHQYHIPHKLVLIGQKFSDLPEDEIFATIKRLRLQQDILWTGYVVEQDMPALLSGAEVFVLPSLYEGFGMPILEAMACGTPVACSNTSSLPEVIGESGVMFDPYTVESIATTLYNLLMDQDLRTELKEKGISRARTFSWEICARKTLDVLESVGKSEL